MTALARPIPRHRLRPAPPFDFSLSLAFLGAFAPTAGEQALAGRALAKAVRIAGRTVAFEARDVGTVEAPELAVALRADAPLPSDVEAAALDRVRFFLSLDDDLRPFYALADGDPPFRALRDRRYGHHQVKFLTPFENACWAVLTQRTPAAAARAAKRRLSERFGGAVDAFGGTLLAFPAPGDLAGADAADLGALVGNARKGEALAGLADAFSRVDEAWLRSAPHDDVRAWLLGLRGIGPWSATFVMLRGLGRMERAVPEDPESVFARELLGAAARVYGLLDHAALREKAERYGPWQGYWAHYLRAG